MIAYFGFGHVSGFLSVSAWVTRPSSDCGVSSVVTFILAARASARLPQATAGLNVFAIVLVVIAAATILPYEIARARREPVAHAAPL